MAAHRPPNDGIVMHWPGHSRSRVRPDGLRIDNIDTSAEPPLRAPPSQAAIAWLLGACCFASIASMRVCDTLLPALATEFSVTVGQAARVIFVFAVAYGVFQLCFGPLGDRYGKLR